MVPDEEFEIFSDDEISIDVPTGSSNSTRSVNGSMLSGKQNFGCTISLDSFPAEHDTTSNAGKENSATNEGLNKDLITREHEESKNYVEKMERNKDVASASQTGAKRDDVIDMNEDMSKKNSAEATGNQARANNMMKRKREKFNRRNTDMAKSDIKKRPDKGVSFPGKKPVGEIIDPGLNGQPRTKHQPKPFKVDNDQSTLAQKSGIRVDVDLNVTKDGDDEEEDDYNGDDDEEEEENGGDSSGDDDNNVDEEDDGEMDGDEDGGNCDYSDDSTSSRTQSRGMTNSDSLSDERLEELALDDDVFQDVMDYVRDPNHKIAIQVINATDDDQKEGETSDLSKDVIKDKTPKLQENDQSDKPEFSVEGEIDVYKTDSIQSGLHSGPISGTKHRDCKTENKEYIQTLDSDRGVSVSNVRLDSRPLSITPTIEVYRGEDVTEENQTSERSTIISYNENSNDTPATPVSPSWSVTGRGEVDNEHIGHLSLLKIKDYPDSCGELSPVSDVEYDYNKRRGSYLKIKLEGRKRQRLSITESEPSKSPTEAKQFDIENNDGNAISLTSEPLLDKRQKMEKVTLTSFADKTAVDSPTFTSPVNTVVDTSDTKTHLSLYNTAREKADSKNASCLKFSDGQQNADYSKVKNINTLNTELIAIYNSSSTEKIKIPDNKLDSGHQMNSTRTGPEQKDEAYFEGYDLLKSCNQTHSTQSFVTDINEIIAKTRKQNTSNSERSQQDFNSDSISNNAETENKDNNEHNSETISLLLSSHNETGNCQIKPSEKCAIENDRRSCNYEHRQLSSRRNAHKNNEISEPNPSIEQSPSQSKQTKIRNFRKRQACENLHERSIPSVRFDDNPKEYKLEAPTNLRSHTSLTGSTQLKTTSFCVKPEKSTKNYLSLPVYSKEGKESCKGNTKVSTGSGHSKMSARMIRSRDEEIEMLGYAERGRSARLNRAQSALTDTARLRSIRKLLKLPDDSNEKPDKSQSSNQEALSIIQELIDGIVGHVCSLGARKWETVMKTHRCTTTDADGEEVLGCLLQTPCTDVDPSAFTCDVIDPVDVGPITKKHEYLISNIVRISSNVTKKFKPEEELMANLPISHWYVEPWQEVTIRQQDGNGYWKDATNQTTDIVKIDDAGKVYYGVRHFLTEPCTLAVVSRPRMTSVTMEKHDQVVNAVTDDRVKMHVFASAEGKCVNMQMVPVDQSLLTEFHSTEENKKACVIVAASPLVQICISHGEPESLAFAVPYEAVQDVKLPSQRSSSPFLRTTHRGSRDSFSQSLLSPYLSPSHSPRRSRSPRRLSDVTTTSNDTGLAFHLAQLDDNDEVRVKLLGGNDNKTIDIVTGQIEENTDTEEQTVKFSVYDRSARLIALQTKGSLEYSDVEKVTRSFVNFLVKHKVSLRISQDPRNVYSILFTAVVDHPHREENHYFKQTYKYFTTAYCKEIQMYEGDIVAISFRGNVDIPDREKLIYSFHGCRGIKRHFDIQVSNPMSQRSLQTYHGALQIYTLKTPRYSGIDRTLAPCSKNGWELTAEFPLLLPKYLKSTPVIINKAPVSLRFHEPLTVDFIRTICTELVNEWTLFAKALGISHARVQAIKQQHRNQVSDKVLMDIIINWMKTQRISQDKVSPLINALRMCKRPKLASELAQRYSAQKVSKTKTTTDKSLQKAFSQVCKSSSVTARWRQLFHHLCQSEENRVNDITNEIDEKYNDEVTKCQNALNHWKTTALAPSVWKLVDALRAVRCDIVAETIVTMESKKKQPDAK